MRKMTWGMVEGGREAKRARKQEEKSSKDDGNMMRALQDQRLEQQKRLEKQNKANRTVIRDKDGTVLYSGMAEAALEQVYEHSTTPFERKLWAKRAGDEIVCSADASPTLKAVRKMLGIRVQGVCPPPVSSFQDPHLPRTFHVFFEHFKHKYQRPSPVQQQCWPAILWGLNVLGIAPTGSGKTLAFCLPACAHILAQKPVTSFVNTISYGVGAQGGKDKQKKRQMTKDEKRERKAIAVGSPQALVLVPTRELALQIAAVCQSFKQLSLSKSGQGGGAGGGIRVHTVAVYGGDRRGKEAQVITPLLPPLSACVTHVFKTK